MFENKRNMKRDFYIDIKGSTKSKWRDIVRGFIIIYLFLSFEEDLKEA